MDTKAVSDKAKVFTTTPLLTDRFSILEFSLSVNIRYRWVYWYWEFYREMELLSCQLICKKTDFK